MKKRYIKPTASEMAALLESTLLVASGQITTADDTATVTPGEGEYDGNDWASRRSIWDDEVDEVF